MRQARLTRRVVFECPVDGFRTSPLVFGVEGVPGSEAASIQVAEHCLITHAGDDDVAFVLVDLPEWP